MPNIQFSCCFGLTEYHHEYCRKGSVDEWPFCIWWNVELNKKKLKGGLSCFAWLCIAAKIKIGTLHVQRHYQLVSSVTTDPPLVVADAHVFPGFARSTVHTCLHTVLLLVVFMIGWFCLKTHSMHANIWHRLYKFAKFVCVYAKGNGNGLMS